MDPQLKAALEILEKAEREWKPPPGPIVLSDEYLRLVERYEALPQSRSGVDKTWVGRLIDDSERELGSAIRTWTREAPSTRSSPGS
ncbi:MAG TPA: hypothetical protein VMS76_17645 [Planctomycetota bacterium]|nr:hypothetical protein [Planctomycetota bacterium]